MTSLGKRFAPVGLFLAVLILFSNLNLALAESSPVTTNQVTSPAQTKSGYGNNFVPTPNAKRVYFQECGHYLGQGFLYFWQQNGKYDAFGCPISEELTVNGLTVQYFQKARLEYHPEYAGSQWETSLGLLGSEVVNAASPEERANPAYQPIEAFPNKKDRLFFDTTKHSLGGGFLEYWQKNGGLYFFGFPVSEEYPQQVDGLWVSVQDFERARFIYHPSFGVKLAALGTQAAQVNGTDTTAAPYDAAVPLMTPTAELWEHWVDVNLKTFKSTFYEGDVPVRTITIISGKPGWETPVGTFKILWRVENEHMRGGSIGSEDYYDLYNVLYTQYFTYEGHALHYAWWRSTFGYQASHGCVNMDLDGSFFAWNFLKVGSRVNIHF